MGYLKAWREVVRPRQEVREGNFTYEGFAADLAQVISGGSTPEYQDATKFFDRTYLTEGLNKLLKHALTRLTNGVGNSVIELKTPFGGGKTHSMLALYHLFTKRNLDRESPVVKKLLDDVNIDSLPDVKVAAFVGTQPSLVQSHKVGNIFVNTIWGDIAAQLVQAAGKPELYEEIRLSDEKAISPGATALKKIFDECGACLVLIDELVAYGVKIGSRQDLPVGTLDNLKNFTQELTEAIKASKNSMVVATLPEHDTELTSNEGKQLASYIDHRFSRLKTVEEIVKAEESFKIVSRRLFTDEVDIQARETICAAFIDMYRKNSAKFPIEAQDSDYKTKLIDCYPIHPEIFDRLYKDWSTIEQFQRTRGVLRFMAKVVHELWNSNDKNCMIMTGAIPVADMKSEFSAYLDDVWNSIIDSEIDGKNSAPSKLDRSEARFGEIAAARRVSRTIFLGSAPTHKEQSIRGVEFKQIRLGVILPEEIGKIAIVDDALNSLKENLSYLYESGGDVTKRFWYDSRPTLNKMAKEEAQNFHIDAVIDKIESTLKNWKKHASFGEVYISPKSEEVIDRQVVQLVIMPPNVDEESFATEILNQRGSSPRQHKNMLVFMAADKNKLSSLEDTVRNLLAWKKIQDDADNRNLTTNQRKEVKEHVTKLGKDFKTQLSQTYSKILAPRAERENLSNITWEILNLNCTNGDNVNKAVDLCKQEGALIGEWNERDLTTQLEVLVWKDKDAVTFEELFGYFTDYLYMSRLYNAETLTKVIKAGVKNGTFAVAEKFSDGKYFGLKFRAVVDKILPATLIVKADTAQVQLDSEKVELPPVVKVTPQIEKIEIVDDVKSTPTVDEPPPLPKKFSMSVQVDKSRLNKQVKDIASEILQELANLNDAKIKLHIDVEVADGISADVQDLINMNCESVGVTNFKFE